MSAWSQAYREKNNPQPHDDDHDLAPAKKTSLINAICIVFHALHFSANREEEEKEEA
jgi:hypothetical protein